MHVQTVARIGTAFQVPQNLHVRRRQLFVQPGVEIAGRVDDGRIATAPDEFRMDGEGLLMECLKFDTGSVNHRAPFFHLGTNIGRRSRRTGVYSRVDAQCSQLLVQ